MARILCWAPLWLQQICASARGHSRARAIMPEAEEAGMHNSVRPRLTHRTGTRSCPAFIGLCMALGSTLRGCFLMQVRHSCCMRIKVISRENMHLLPACCTQCTKDRASSTLAHTRTVPVTQLADNPVHVTMRYFTTRPSTLSKIILFLLVLVGGCCTTGPANARTRSQACTFHPAALHWPSLIKLPPCLPAAELSRVCVHHIRTGPNDNFVQKQ